MFKKFPKRGSFFPHRQKVQKGTPKNSQFYKTVFPLTLFRRLCSVRPNQDAPVQRESRTSYVGTVFSSVAIRLLVPNSCKGTKYHPQQQLANHVTHSKVVIPRLLQHLGDLHCGIRGRKCQHQCHEFPTSSCDDNPYPSSIPVFSRARCFLRMLPTIELCEQRSFSPDQ